MSKGMKVGDIDPRLIDAMHKSQTGRSEQNLDDLLQLVEDTASMLRGMTLDPAIPGHAKSAMYARIAELESAVQKCLG